MYFNFYSSILHHWHEFMVVHPPIADKKVLTSSSRAVRSRAAALRGNGALTNYTYCRLGGSAGPLRMAAQKWLANVRDPSLTSQTLTLQTGLDVFLSSSNVQNAATHCKDAVSEIVTYVFRKPLSIQLHCCRISLPFNTNECKSASQVHLFSTAASTGYHGQWPLPTQ